MIENKAELTDEELDALTMRHILEAYGARAKLNKLIAYLSGKGPDAMVNKQAIMSVLQEADNEEIGMV
jgi:Lon protease-like protein